MFKYFLYRFAQFCFAILPIRTSYFIAKVLSDCVYLFSWRDRRIVKKNLKQIIGDVENLNQRTREVFRNFGIYLVEFFYMKQKVSKEFIEKNINCKNISVLENVLKENKGGVLLTGHIGNWELGGVVLATLGFPVVAIALPHKERPVNDLFNQQRETHGVTIVQPHLAIRKCTEALKENKLIALLADRDFSTSGEIMDFLGRKTTIPKGAAMFSIKSEVPIIPVFCIRRENYTFDLEVEDPIYPSDCQVSENEKENVLELMCRYTRIIEQKIKEYPTQWLMFRKYWIENL